MVSSKKKVEHRLYFQFFQQADVQGKPMIFLTSHLESTAEHTTERKRQLKIGFSRMTASLPDCTVVFGGDLNLRDKEVCSCIGCSLPCDFFYINFISPLVLGFILANSRNYDFDSFAKCHVVIFTDCHELLIYY